MTIEFEQDQAVEYQGKRFLIAKRPTDLFEVLLKNPKTNDHFRAPMSELSPVSDNEEGQKETEQRPIESFTEKERQKADYRYSIIEPLLEKRGDKQAVLNVAAKTGISKSTLYDWINKFDMYGSVIGLIDKEGRGKKGVSRLLERVRKIVIESVDHGIQTGMTFNNIYMDVWDKCEEQGLKVPHANTLRLHYKLYDREKKLAAIKGKRTAEQQFGDAATGMHESVAPLHWVEIDHTIADVMLVEEGTRKVLGRPWITVLIDVFSRMVLGFYVSFDAPGAFGTGRAIIHAMLTKDKWLTEMELDPKLWPCWGKMTNIRCDNAKEFRGNMLVEASKSYGMNFEFRAPKKPEMGAYIERFMGTFGTWLKDIKGTTNVSKELRALAKPEKTAALTITEFKKWLTLAIAIYHRDYHSGVNMSPLEKWNQGLFNKATGIGVPGIIPDTPKLKLDFLPFWKRTVQRTGIKINKIFYWGDVLRKYINSVDEETQGKHGSKKPKREFIFKMDRRDISKIYFLDPGLNKYFEIPYSKLSGPTMSVWDYRKAVLQLRANGEAVDQDSIFAMYRKQKALEQEGSKKTKQAQKAAARKDELSREERIEVPVAKPEPVMHTLFKLDQTEIKPYEIDYGKKAFK